MLYMIVFHLTDVSNIFSLTAQIFTQPTRGQVLDTTRQWQVKNLCSSIPVIHTSDTYQ